MTIEDNIRDEKLQYRTNREAATISALKYLKTEEILPSDQSRIIEQAKFTYLALGKLKKKTTDGQGGKQILSNQQLKIHFQDVN